MGVFDPWLDRGAVPIEALDPGGAEVVMLGEFNHFVHEKTDFRIAMVDHFGRRGFSVCAEELGWSDGSRISAYFAARDEAMLERLSLFGWRGDARKDRDDRPEGIFRPAFDTYPRDLMRAEHARFYRAIAPRAYFGFDVAAGHDGGYADLDVLAANAGSGMSAFREDLARVSGESAAAEIIRLNALRLRFSSEMDIAARAALDALIDGVIYTRMIRDTESYQATAPAMAFREDAMKRRLADILALAAGPIILMGHALHLARDDRQIDSVGAVGPGGGTASSLGHHIVRELGLKTFSVWMIYGAGEDSQPLPDLPRRVSFPSDTLNAILAARFPEPTLILTQGAPDVRVRIGHMYGASVRTRLKAQVDAIYFVPDVTPMRID